MNSTAIVDERAHAWSAAGDHVGVLVLHGFTGSPAGVAPLARHLADAGHSVELPRLPGHGTNWRDLETTTWHDWAATAAAALDRLRSRCDTVVVAGLSIGGILALLLAQRRPADVDGLVLINPKITLDSPLLLLRPVMGAVTRVMPSVAGVANDIARPGVSEVAYPRVPLRPAVSMVELQQLVRSDLDRVHVPLLVLTSVVDHVADPADSGIILRGVRSSSAEQVWLERSFHVATLDYDAELVADRTTGFVATIAATAAAGSADPPPAPGPTGAAGHDTGEPVG